MSLRQVPWYTVILLVGALVVPLLLGSYLLSLLTRVLVLALLALSVDLLAGYLGRVPLGHAGIFGTSGYVLAYALTRTEIPLVPSVGMALVAGIAISALFGLLAVRTEGIFFIMITLAEGMIAWGVVQRWTTVTGGANGIRGIPRPAPVNGDLAFYYLSLAVLVAGFWVLTKLVESPFGLSLVGIREREERMSHLGFNPFLHKLFAFLVSGLYASVAGVLFSLQNGFISPSSMDLMTSAEVLLMVLLGGAGTLWGAVLGSGVVLSVQNLVGLYTDRWMIVMGVLFVVTMLFFRDGLMGMVREISGRTSRG